MTGTVELTALTELSFSIMSRQMRRQYDSMNQRLKPTRTMIGKM